MTAVCGKGGSVAETLTERVRTLLNDMEDASLTTGGLLLTRTEWNRLAALLTRDDAETPPLDQPLTERLSALADLLRGCEYWAEANGKGTARPRLTLADLDRIVALLRAEDERVEREASDARRMDAWVRVERIRGQVLPEWDAWTLAAHRELPLPELRALEAAYIKARDGAKS